MAPLLSAPLSPSCFLHSLQLDFGGGGDGVGPGLSKQAGLSTKGKVYPEPQEPFAYAEFMSKPLTPPSP